MKEKKRIIILGATGSVGQTVLNEVARWPDLFEIVGISCNKNTALAELIAQKFNVPYIAVTGTGKVNCNSSKSKLFTGVQGLTQLVTEVDFDILVVAISGINGLKPTLRAIERGKTIVLASKEILVEAGNIVMQRAREKNVSILPLDSEHNAIFQCLKGDCRFIKKLQLTASGGKFWNQPTSTMENVTVSEVLRHPKWSMGQKITVDSSTMANKGLEIIEAMHLFNVKSDQIEVVIHPDCVIHSLVGFQDGSFLAQLSPVSMAYATRYCLFFPDRCEIADKTELDLINLVQLRFYAPDFEKFPCLKLAYQVAKMNASMQIAYNAANEIAVNHFLNGEFSLTYIPEVIEQTLEKVEDKNYQTLEEILAVDQMVRCWAEQIVRRKAIRKSA